ncbi:Protein FAM3B, partial [Dryobates pubescens]
SLADFVKFAGLLLASLASLYVGYLLADLVPTQRVARSIANLQDIGKKPVLRAPVPKRQKCDHWSPCPPGHYAYRILSGVGKDSAPKICFEDELVFCKFRNCKINKQLSAANRLLFSGSGYVINSTDHSGEMMTFIKNAPEGSLLLMATYYDGSVGLKNDARNLVKELGSKEIWNMKFRSSWAFIGAKGFKLPDDTQKEKINHSDKKSNRYGGWPAEIQIEGCIPRNLI